MSDLERHKWMAIGIRAKREAIERELARLKCVEEYHAEQVRLLSMSAEECECAGKQGLALLAGADATQSEPSE